MCWVCVECHHWEKLGEGYIGLCTVFAISCKSVINSKFKNILNGRLYIGIKGGLLLKSRLFTVIHLHRSLDQQEDGFYSTVPRISVSGHPDHIVWSPITQHSFRNQDLTLLFSYSPPYHVPPLPSSNPKFIHFDLDRNRRDHLSCHWTLSVNALLRKETVWHFWWVS